MSKLSLNQLKLLFAKYSPLYTKNKLFDIYIKITGDYSQTADFIRKKYNHEIFQGYLNETVIKSSFIQNFCINKSLKNTITIFELNSGKSRADICMINDKSTVYEIKTEYDTTFRLDKQIEDYKKFFDYLYIIIHKNFIEKFIEEIDASIGIIFYRINRLGNITFETYRKPILNYELNPKSQLEQLTKKQLLQIYPNIISKENIINQILNNYSSHEINILFKVNMKKKYKGQWKFLVNNIEKIEPLDYQWFFKNNVAPEIVYK